jgi:transglutaminase-like putative cysteine protease
MRAIGIPTRLVNGIVYQDGRFYYHAWVEAWNGSRWIGYDSTRPAPRLTAAHIKTVQGAVSDVMVGFLIESPRIEVLPAVGRP